MSADTKTPDPTLIASIAHLVSVMEAYEPYFAAVVPRRQYVAALAMGKARVREAARAGLTRADYLAAMERVDSVVEALEPIAHDALARREVRHG